MSTRSVSSSRGGAANARGGKAPTKAGPKGPATKVQFPAPLPSAVERIIGGRVAAVTIEYTAYGVQTFVVYNDGTPRCTLEQHERLQKEAKASKVFTEEVSRYRERIVERQLRVKLPVLENREMLEAWLAAMPADTRKALTMSNRGFRAQQSTNDVPPKAEVKEVRGGPRAPIRSGSEITRQ